MSATSVLPEYSWPLIFRISWPNSVLNDSTSSFPHEALISQDCLLLYNFLGYPGLITQPCLSTMQGPLFTVKPIGPVQVIAVVVVVVGWGTGGGVGTGVGGTGEGVGSGVGGTGEGVGTGLGGAGGGDGTGVGGEGER
eukprot:TRINITY_DN4130_c0_g1_i1.p2 TRINITY_DN4130_c0_g1~~TRINITY_DN4130_c0_g1_i1.p2  ORF type:complete len:138 (+),score=9.54 TRINITY_DN4130_c0_g1_i1:238-651(+)